MTAEERGAELVKALDVKLAVVDRGFASMDEWRVVAREIAASAIRAAEDEALERAAAEIESWAEPPGENDSEGSKAIRFAVRKIHALKSSSPTRKEGAP